MKAPFPLRCVLLVLPALSLAADDDKAPGAEIFDSPDLDRKPLEWKPGMSTAHRAALPANAAEVVDKMEKFISARELALAGKITAARKAAAEKLAASATKAGEAGREQFEAASNRCLTKSPAERLAHPVAPSALTLASTWTLKEG